MVSFLSLELFCIEISNNEISIETKSSKKRKLNEVEE